MNPLTGLPPIIWMVLFHATILTITSIIMEYVIIKKRLPLKNMLLRSIIANLLSLVAGITIIISLPQMLGGDLGGMNEDYSSYSKFTLFIAFIPLFITSVLIEFPVYLRWGKTEIETLKKTMGAVMIANAVSSIVVLIFYMVFMV